MSIWNIFTTKHEDARILYDSLAVNLDKEEVSEVIAVLDNKDSEELINLIDYIITGVTFEGDHLISLVIDALRDKIESDKWSGYDSWEI